MTEVTVTDEMVEIAAKAIFDAENDLDGDQIGDMIQDDFRVDVRDGDKGLGDTMKVCRAAARAALSAALPLVVAGERARFAAWHDEKAEGFRSVAQSIRREWTGPDYSAEDNAANMRDARDHDTIAGFHERCAAAIRSDKGSE